MRCAALTPTRGRYESCEASAVLMLTTPAGDVLAVSAIAAPAIEAIMRAMRTMVWDFRIGSYLLSNSVVVGWLISTLVLSRFPFHRVCLVFGITSFRGRHTSSGPPCGMSAQVIERIWLSAIAEAIRCQERRGASRLFDAGRLLYSKRGVHEGKTRDLSLSPRMKSIGITAKVTSSAAVRYAKELAATLVGRGFDVCFDDLTGAAVGDGARCFAKTEIGSHSDLLITFGGDGTLLSVARHAPAHVPILG